MRLCQFSSSLVLVCSSILNITCKGVLTEHHSSCITSWAPHRLPSQSPCRTGAWTLDTADSFHRSTRVKVSGSEESVGFFHGNPFASFRTGLGASRKGGHGSILGPKLFDVSDATFLHGQSLRRILCGTEHLKTHAHRTSSFQLDGKDRNTRINLVLGCVRHIFYPCRRIPQIQTWNDTSSVHPPGKDPWRLVLLAKALDKILSLGIPHSWMLLGMSWWLEDCDHKSYEIHYRKIQANSTQRPTASQWTHMAQSHLNYLHIPPYLDLKTWGATRLWPPQPSCSAFALWWENDLVDTFADLQGWSSLMSLSNVRICSREGRAFW